MVFVNWILTSKNLRHNRNEEWNEFYQNLLSCVLKDLPVTKEYAYRRKRQEHVDETLATNLTSDQKEMMDEVLLELGLAQEHETEFIYQQELKDCVWLLNNLELLA